jgi:hypothetical protein
VVCAGLQRLRHVAIEDLRAWNSRPSSCVTGRYLLGGKLDTARFALGAVFVYQLALLYRHEEQASGANCGLEAFFRVARAIITLGSADTRRRHHGSVYLPLRFGEYPGAHADGGSVGDDHLLDPIHCGRTRSPFSGDIRIHSAAFEQVLEKFYDSKLSDLRG